MTDGSLDISEKIKEVSIAEFFEKNRHLLGYENPAKSLYTVVKEFVDNSIDACIEAGILPEIEVRLRRIDENRYRVRIIDNGPGINPKKLPIALGKFLVGSKFYRLRQSIGTQGIGAKGAILYAQLTTSKPARIYTSTINSDKIYYFELMIDVRKNEPKIIKSAEEENKYKWHGLDVEIEVEGKYSNKIEEYLKFIWLTNSFAKIIFDKDGEKIVLDRVSDKLPKQPKEIKPHPYGVEFGVFKRFLEITDRKTLLDFLTKEFSRISLKTAIKILRLSLRGEEIEIKNKEKKVFDILNNFFNSENVVKAVLEEMNLDSNKKIIDLNEQELRKFFLSYKILEYLYKKPSEITLQDAEKIFNSMQKVKIRAPPTDCLSQLDNKYLIDALKKLYPAEYYVAITRKPKVYRGFPFQIQVAIAYGLKDSSKIEEEDVSDSQSIILRFANHTPLLYNARDCAITKVLMSINWNHYGISVGKSNLPAENVLILVDFISVWIPYKSEGKQAIAEYPEIIKELELAIQEALRKVSIHISKKKRAELVKMKRNVFERYLPEVAKSIAILANYDEKEIEKKLLEIANKKLPEIKIET
ncbi:MAG: DNA topoisomerase VI subunit B [Candidatus Aenigmatarchaeota archaeon]